MDTPASERNGAGGKKEARLDNFFGAKNQTSASGTATKSEVNKVQEPEKSVISPDSTPSTPAKQVVFRSVDKELTLYYRAGFTDKSHGIASYTPSVGVQFDDYHYRIDDTPENAKTIAWLRQHPSFGISFREVPDMNNVVELPAISELEQMTISELRGICHKNAVKHADDASKEALILALIKSQR